MRKGFELSLVLLCLMIVLASGMMIHTPARLTVISRSPTQTQTSGYSTRWYAGSVYPSWLPTQQAGEINMTITIPSSAPRSDEFYYLLLSAWDNNGSYDQIGFSNFYGTWALTYSWSTGPPSNLTFHYPKSPSETRTLTQGATYTFWISFWTGDGVALFGADQETPQSGGTTFWSVNASTGGNYLILSNLYSGYPNYANYEEVLFTHIPGGSPNFDFYFYNNNWVALNHTAYPATWTNLTTTASAPSNVVVKINGNAVLVDNGNEIVNESTDYPLAVILASTAGVVAMVAAVIVIEKRKAREVSAS